MLLWWLAAVLLMARASLFEVRRTAAMPLGRCTGSFGLRGLSSDFTAGGCRAWMGCSLARRPARRPITTRGAVLMLTISLLLLASRLFRPRFMFRCAGRNHGQRNPPARFVDF